MAQPAQMTRLKKGDLAPDFELPDMDGNLWRLSDLRGKRVIVYFYPADDTPGCTAEACDFRDAYPDLADAGYTVLGISPQGAESHRRFTEKHGLNFPLLIDAEFTTARKFGVTTNEERYFRGIPLKVKRSTFLVDEEGRLEDAQYGVSAKGHVERLRQHVGV